MKFDSRLITGIGIGVIMGLHYHTNLIVYLPILTVVTMILLLKTVRR